MPEFYPLIPQPARRRNRWTSCAPAPGVLDEAVSDRLLIGDFSLVPRSACDYHRAGAAGSRTGRNGAASLQQAAVDIDHAAGGKPFSIASR